MLFRHLWIFLMVSASLLTPMKTEQSRQLTHPSHEKISDRPLVIDVSSRTRRQAPKRQGIFSLLGQLLRQTKNETDSAYQQIYQLITDSFGNNRTTPSQDLTTATSVGSDAEGREGENNATATTPAPYIATSGVLRTILRRNLLGLRNLFQKEWRTALTDSSKNVVAAGREFRTAIRPIIASNSSSSTANSVRRRDVLTHS